jgi:ubiquinone/menaquinone biosynthesis C-methylase UbiE
MSEFSLKPITGRGYDEYLEWLNIGDEDLRGRVLDLGVGLGRFAREAAERGIDVVALEPELCREDIQKYYEGVPHAVAAEAQDLPFKDASFDTVLSLFAVPLEVGRANYARTYQGIFRVLRPGGRCYLTPLNATNLELSIPHLVQAHIPYSLRTVETPFGPMEEWKRLTLEKPNN